MFIFFVHGGPGLNSTPELTLLKNRFKAQGCEFTGWNEPSEFRDSEFTDYSLKNSINSLRMALEKAYLSYPKMVIVAHSFGAYLLDQVIESLSFRPEFLFLISPVADLNVLDRRIIEAGSFFSKDPLTKTKLDLYLSDFRDEVGLSDERLEVLGTAVAIPGLNNAYWGRGEFTDAYLNLFSGINSFNMNSFIAIRKTCQNMRMNTNHGIKTIALFGSKDRITPLEDWNLCGPKLPNLILSLVDGVGHYAHIESEILLKLIPDILEKPVKNLKENAYV